MACLLCPWPHCHLSKSLRDSTQTHHLLWRPAGAVLSPLFSFFNLPSTLSRYSFHHGLLCRRRVDRRKIPDIPPDVTKLTNRLNDVLGPISDWATTNKLTIALTKSSITLSTLWSKQINFHPQISINNNITFDPLFSVDLVSKTLPLNRLNAAKL